MARCELVCGIVMGLVSLAGVAGAQPIVILPDHVTFGATVAASENGVADVGAAPEFAASLEVPLYSPYRLRLDVGRTAWQLGSRARIGGADSATLTRASATLVKAVLPRRLGVPVGTYAGVGAGLYRYDAGIANDGPLTKLGVNLLGGLELTLPNDRVVLGWEMQLLASSGRNTASSSSSGVLVLQGGMAVRYRF